jgi:hypothetical protein
MPMGDKARPGLARVEQWRKTRERPGRMPEPLWRVVVQVARKHGINPVARALRLDYYSVKRRVLGKKRSSKVNSGPSFVAVDLMPPGMVPQCVLEIEDPSGSKLTVRLSGPVDVVALAEAFWRQRR